MLDEPTNNLDLEMRQALARALQDYPGAVLMVSHDRHLLRTVIDEFYIVANGRAKPFDGDLDDYAKWAASNPRDAVEKAAELKAARKQADAAQRNRSSALKSELARLDRQLAKMQRQQQEIELQLAAADIYDAANKSRLRELLEQQTKLTHELDQAKPTGWKSLNYCSRKAVARRAGRSFQLVFESAGRPQPSGPVSASALNHGERLYRDTSRRPRS